MKKFCACSCLLGLLLIASPFPVFAEDSDDGEVNVCSANGSHCTTTVGGDVAAAQRYVDGLSAKGATTDRAFGIRTTGPHGSSGSSVTNGFGLGTLTGSVGSSPLIVGGGIGGGISQNPIGGLISQSGPSLSGSGYVIVAGQKLSPTVAPTIADFGPASLTSTSGLLGGLNTALGSSSGLNSQVLGTVAGLAGLAASGKNLDSVVKGLKNTAETQIKIAGTTALLGGLKGTALDGVIKTTGNGTSLGVNTGALATKVVDYFKGTAGALGYSGDLTSIGYDSEYFTSLTDNIASLGFNEGDISSVIGNFPSVEGFSGFLGSAVTAGYSGEALRGLMENASLKGLTIGDLAGALEDFSGEGFSQLVDIDYKIPGFDLAGGEAGLDLGGVESIAGIATVDAGAMAAFADSDTVGDLFAGGGAGGLLGTMGGGGAAGGATEWKML